jgi:hypothetical protein
MIAMTVTPTMASAVKMLAGALKGTVAASHSA